MTSTMTIARISNKNGVQFTVVRVRVVLRKTGYYEYNLRQFRSDVGHVRILYLYNYSFFNLSSVSIDRSFGGQPVRGTGLCTPFVTACLKDFLFQIIRSPPRHAEVVVESMSPRAAVACYRRAFANVGYTLTDAYTEWGNPDIDYDIDEYESYDTTTPWRGSMEFELRGGLPIDVLDLTSSSTRRSQTLSLLRQRTAR